MLNKDQYGFEYYEWSSFKWKKVDSIFDFVEIDPKFEDYYKPKIGLKYIIYSQLSDTYQVYKITEFSRDENIELFIEKGLVYLLNE
jgi:hypothetical protein